MKTIVSDLHLPESTIKPRRQISEFHQKLDEEFQKFLLSGTPLHSIVCPGCGSINMAPAFQKSGLNYLECSDCDSVYSSPRPTAEALDSFYRASEAIRYWHHVLLPDTQENRLSKIIKPRARWVFGAMDRYQPKCSHVLDIGQHSALLVCELLQAGGGNFRITLAGQLADLENGIPDSPNLKISPSPILGLSQLELADMVLAFDALDRAQDLDELMASVHSVLKPQGLMLTASTLISGFDLQMLWSESEGIYPPERMNLLSADGMLKLCKRHGFEILEFSTPGMFDVEIVQRAILENPDAAWPKFLKSMLTRSDPHVLEGFQEFLQKYRLSSFARLALRKI
jgi:hypothetical protein